MRILFLVGALIFFYCNVTQAQLCSGLGQTPPTAFPVCGTTTFVQNSVPLCGGRVIPVPCFDGAQYEDTNPFWYKFTCYAAGTLGFVITPMVLSDDYDWQLFDITNRNPNDVFTDPSLFVAGNWSFMSGTTGASASGTGFLSCAANPITFCQMPTLIAGHQYLLIVSHFTNSQSGYTLVFGGGTASITDPNVPVIQSATPNCDGTSIVVKFNKPLKCNSLTANGSEFSITPSGTITTATGHGCGAGFNIDSITLTLSGPLPPGTYTLSATNGADGNTLLDVCDVAIVQGNNVTFTIPPPPPLPMGTAAISGCAPTIVTITFANPVRCNSVATDGSDFSITGPSTVAVTSASATCGPNGTTSTIQLQLNAPLTSGGTYQVLVNTGSDGNTIVGNCSSAVPVGANTTFNLASPPPLTMGTVTQPGCTASTITLTFTDTLLCQSIASNGSDFIITGASPIIVTGATPVCNGNGQTNSITLQLSGSISTSGNYQVQVATGSDGNTLLGTCSQAMPTGATAAFNIPVMPPSIMNGSVSPGCAPTSIRVGMSQPVKCSSIASNGSDFIVSGPTGVTVTGATVNCNAGFTDTIIIHFAAPVTNAGTFQLQVVTGSDGNTLLNDCDRPTPAGSFINFSTADTVSAAFNYQVSSDCDNNQVVFTNNGGNGITTWSWSVNGAPSGNQQVLSQQFPATSQQAIQLIVTNGQCSDTSTQTILFDDKVSADFEMNSPVCPGDSVVFTNLTSGNVDTWSWDFGNGQSSNLSQPPVQGYPNTGQEEIYTVTLSVSNNLGCNNSITKTVKVLASCLILVPTAFTPNNDGLNDQLYPLNAFKADQLEFRIFNRWGQLVFESRDYTRKWDGKLGGIEQASGVYVWTLRYKHRDTGQEFTQKGTTMLIR